MNKKETLEIFDNLIEETRNMSQEEFDKRDRRSQIKLIIKENQFEDAVDKLIEEDFCVSKSEARRVCHQLGGNK